MGAAAAAAAAAVGGSTTVLNKPSPRCSQYLRSNTFGGSATNLKNLVVSTETLSVAPTVTTNASTQARTGSVFSEVSGMVFGRAAGSRRRSSVRHGSSASGGHVTASLMVDVHALRLPEVDDELLLRNHQPMEQRRRAMSDVERKARE